MFTLYYVTNTCKRLQTVELLAGILQCNGGKKTSNMVSSFFVVYSNRNKSALVRDLLSYSSLFVGQLYEDNLLALRARDYIFFTTDIRTVNNYAANNCQS